MKLLLPKDTHVASANSAIGPDLSVVSCCAHSMTPSHTLFLQISATANITISAMFPLAYRMLVLGAAMTMWETLDVPTQLAAAAMKEEASRKHHHDP
ncbi:hypothetical protein HYALB_00012113 [Hymenoscyphus albidus]|uniref:Uncharacterized protein n=1 Tax=Hymenoscyphus albidus TaxID=595503 RepID=A0A9N9LFW1_9HELO|nr:hypothetical protein HYALB_00012113 [Hymenoscyphus albidus]